MKKKILCWLIMMLMVVLTACGTEKKDEVLSDETTTAVTTTIEEGFNVDLGKKVLVDNEFATISIKETTQMDNFLKLYLQIENKLNSDLSVATSFAEEEWCSVNGYMVEDGFLIDESEKVGDDVIPAKGVATRVMMISIKELELYGLTGIADIELRFLGIDNGDLWNNFQTDIIKITTDNAENYDYTKDTYLNKLKENEKLIFLEENVFDDKGIKVVSHAVVEEYESEPYIYIEFINTTEDIVKTELSTLTLNGIELDKDLNEILILNPGTRRVVSFRMSQLAGWEDEEVKAITNIEQFEYEFTVENYEDRDEITSGYVKLEIK